MKTNDPVIFVIEDNKLYNSLVVKHLNNNGFRKVFPFLSGEESIISLLVQKPDIVIQDYYLEGMNGIEVLKKLKSKYPEAEFIFLSAQESMEVTVKTMRHGAFDYVIKDEAAMDKLIDRINKIIAIRKLKQNNKMLRIGLVLFFVVVLILFLILYFLFIKQV
jgi:DNA-binding NtrC family response regulator